ncbi:glycosyltransferase family 2 protein [Defluviimonas sp. SAOS-178_SWC]|uniref:glycosyltransferase family 2 protein n=1 Tax=Defluviimonas sp. SAOS-178_SWC TaxID=3121287 RepID=UPI0032222021
MHFASLNDLLAKGAGLLAKGPVALVFAEDAVEIASTVTHHAAAGFREVVVFLPEGIDIPATVEAAAQWVRHDTHAPQALETAVNALIAIAPATTWLYYCYNAEYLFFPFCETRSVGELLTFHAEERRDAMLTYVVDLYAPDLGRAPNAVSLDEAMLDRSGYYAQARRDPANHNHPKERQLDFFGGLRWRFEEHIPKARRKIDRIALFRPQAGLRLRPDHTFSIEEYNTYACPWHHNLTAAVASFRAAKALATNPGSKFDIQGFTWRNSAKFDWHSQQLMDLGLMEPGQWF